MPTPRNRYNKSLEDLFNTKVEEINPPTWKVETTPDVAKRNLEQAVRKGFGKVFGETAKLEGREPDELAEEIRATQIGLSGQGGIRKGEGTGEALKKYGKLIGDALGLGIKGDEKVNINGVEVSYGSSPDVDDGGKAMLPGVWKNFRQSPHSKANPERVKELYEKAFGWHPGKRLKAYRAQKEMGGATTHGGRGGVFMSAGNLGRGDKTWGEVLPEAVNSSYISSSSMGNTGGDNLAVAEVELENPLIIRGRLGEGTIKALRGTKTRNDINELINQDDRLYEEAFKKARVPKTEQKEVLEGSGERIWPPKERIGSYLASREGFDALLEAPYDARKYTYNRPPWMADTTIIPPTHYEGSEGKPELFLLNPPDARASRIEVGKTLSDPSQYNRRDVNWIVNSLPSKIYDIHQGVILNSLAKNGDEDWWWDYYASPLVLSLKTTSDYALSNLSNPKLAAKFTNASNKLDNYRKLYPSDIRTILPFNVRDDIAETLYSLRDEFRSALEDSIKPPPVPDIPVESPSQMRRYRSSPSYQRQANWMSGENVKSPSSHSPKPPPMPSPPPIDWEGPLSDWKGKWQDWTEGDIFWSQPVYDDTISIADGVNWLAHHTFNPEADGVYKSTINFISPAEWNNIAANVKKVNGEYVFPDGVPVKFADNDAAKLFDNLYSSHVDNKFLTDNQLIIDDDVPF